MEQSKFLYPTVEHMYLSAYETFFNFARHRENFSSTTSGDSLFGTLFAIAMIALFLFVQMFIVKWLWNTVLVRVVDCVKPLPNVFYTFGLLVLIGLLFPC